VSDDAELPGGRCLRLRPWTDSDLGLMVALNTPEMTAHVGGPESDERVRQRLRSYISEPGEGRDDAGAMFVIEVTGTGRARGPVAAGENRERPGTAAGSIGFWPLRWAGQPICETGWAVLPAYQGLGVASTAARLVVAKAAAARLAPTLHAFPAVDHPASNAVCRRSGFRLIGPAEFEYPKGHLMQVNDWSIALENLSS
jgi:RimJ/RimL family protein N-acetyltransferase